ncbi:DoxX family protein [Pseudonocardia kunmingensis]|uniref:DoxX-like protein n=1 Tax=Pseudonocardia kunmingensis TaxID=630975 RepID=A0A543CYK0_9PSEU|nr:DoxX family protein [Pseudonocardia kunmingensis]TQM02159.1 DoxX-like protein [Pseudonocardia kunmingensis]
MTTTALQDASDPSSAVARSGWDRNRVRAVAYWVTTLVIVVELASGAVWNLVPIDWITAQLDHLGYPAYFAVILGVWQAAAAVAIIVPGFALIKEWAYVGSFFLWSGAAWSHLIVGDSGPDLWGVPLVFGVCAIASWVLRPSDRRLPVTQLRRHRDDATAGSSTAARALRNGRRAWAVSSGLLVLAYAFSFLTLPVIEPVMHDRAVELGWIDP